MHWKIRELAKWCHGRQLVHCPESIHSHHVMINNRFGMDKNKFLGTFMTSSLKHCPTFFSCGIHSFYMHMWRFNISSSGWQQTGWLMGSQNFSAVGERYSFICFFFLVLIICTIWTYTSSLLKIPILIISRTNLT